VGGTRLKRRPLVGGQDVEHCAGQLGWGRHLVVGQLGASGIVYTLDCVAYNKTAVNSRTVDCVAGSRKSTCTAGIVMVCCLPVIVGLIAMFAYLSDNIPWSARRAGDGPRRAGRIATHGPRR
jgi:hypothetical protein